MNEDLEAILILGAAIIGSAIIGYVSTNIFVSAAGIGLIFWVGYKIRESKQVIDEEKNKKVKKLTKKEKENLYYKKILEESK